MLNCRISHAKVAGESIYVLWVLMSLSSVCIAQGFVSGPRSVAMFMSADDKRCHAIAALQSGAVEDVSHDCTGSALSTVQLAVLEQPVAVSAYYAPYNEMRHVIVVQKNGDLYDIRYKTDIQPAAIRLINVNDFGVPVAVSAWLDGVNNRNIALLSILNGAAALSAYQAQVGKPGSINLLTTFPGLKPIDLGALYVDHDNTNKVQVALTMSNGSTSLKFVSWPRSKTPTSSDIKMDFEGTNTPWGTNFPGLGAPAQSIISLGTSEGIYGNYQPWGTIIVTNFLNSSGEIKTFSINNGGGEISPGSASLASVHPIAISNFALMTLATFPAAVGEFVLASADGRLFLVSSTAPASSQESPSWAWKVLDTF